MITRLLTAEVWINLILFFAKEEIKEGIMNGKKKGRKEYGRTGKK